MLNERLFLVYLVIGTAFVVIGSRLIERRALRKSVWLLVLSVWAVSGGFLITSILRTRPIFGAVEAGNLGAIQRLLHRTPALVRARTFWSETLLHAAVEKGDNQVVVLLLKAGGDVNAKDWSDVTPLHLAACNGNVSVTETLLKWGANVNAAGFRHHDTPLHVAADRGYADEAKVLLNYGANVNAMDLLHNTPLQLAQENHHTNVIAILKAPPLPKHESTLPASRTGGEQRIQ